MGGTCARPTCGRARPLHRWLLGRPCRGPHRRGAAERARPGRVLRSRRSRNDVVSAASRAHPANGIAIVAYGASSPLGEGSAAIEAPTVTRVGRDDELASAGLLRPYIARASVEAGGR